jgi:hypothetical protein
MRVAKQPSNWRWLKRAACYSSRIGSRAGASFKPTARAASQSRAPSGLQVNDELKPRGLRSAGPPASQYSLKLKANAAVVGRGLGALAKGGGERARLAEPDVECDFRHRQLALRQQVLGPLNTAVGQIAVRRDAERLLERAAKMVWAELDQPGQERQRDSVGKMLLDILRQLLSLPPGEPPCWSASSAAQPSFSRISSCASAMPSTSI